MAAKSPSQFHGSWGQVSDPAQLPNVSGATIQDAAVERGDTCYSLSDDKMYICSNETLGAASWDQAGGGSTSGGTLIFEWNRTDTSQFEGVDVFADGGGSIAMSVIAVSERGPALRLVGTGITMSAVRLATNAIAFPDERRDMLIEYEQHDIVEGPGGYAGFAVCADNAGSYHGFNQLVTGVAGWSSRIDAAARSTSGSTGNGLGTQGVYGRVLIRGRKPAATPPQIAGFSSGWNQTVGRIGDSLRSGSNRGGFAPFGSGGALPATWNGLACNRWGLALQSSGGSAPPTSWDILDLRVYLI